MKSREKTFRVVGTVLGLSLLAGIALQFISNEGSYPSREESQQIVDRMNSEYVNDTYGGTTPEETLRLFTDALKKGDTELASKYFLPEDRLDNKKYLDEMLKKNEISKIINDIDSGEVSLSGDKAFLSIFENGRKVAGLVLGKNTKTSRWKIIEF